MRSTSYRCGLDFGTSNSVITITDIKTKKVLFTHSDKSILYFPAIKGANCIVGSKAEEMFVEDNLKGRLLKSIKTILKQENFKYTWINGEQFTPEDLVSFIIAHFKKIAEEFLNDEISDVILGRPALFSEENDLENLATERLMNAAKKAGFKNITLHFEPVAAAFSYEVNLTKDEKVLIADFGGGTSDFSIMNLSKNNIFNTNRNSDIIAYGGLYIGGDLFDSEIMWHKVSPSLGKGLTYRTYNKEIEIPSIIYSELKHWERSFQLKESKLRKSLDKYYVFSGQNKKIDNLRVLIDSNNIYSLYKVIEQSKIDLSTKSESKITFQCNELYINDLITLAEFDKMINKHTSKIQSYLIDLMDNNNVSPKDIDAVFITGGSSSVVSIKNIFTKLFDIQKIHMGDAFNSVSYGLSLIN